MYVGFFCSSLILVVLQIQYLLLSYWRRKTSKKKGGIINIPFLLGSGFMLCVLCWIDIIFICNAFKCATADEWECAHRHIAIQVTANEQIYSVDDQLEIWNGIKIIYCWFEESLKWDFFLCLLFFIFWSNSSGIAAAVKNCKTVIKKNESRIYGFLIWQQRILVSFVHVAQFKKTHKKCYQGVGI